MNYFIIVLVTLLSFTDSIAQTIAVEQPAEFPGGMRKFYEYLSGHLHYPKQARKNGISGKVFIEFAVKETGEIDQDSVRVVPKTELINRMSEERVAEVVSDESLEAEAMQVIRNSPK